MSAFNQWIFLYFRIISLLENCHAWGELGNLSSLVKSCRQKRSGPRTEPCGTSVARCCDLDTSPLQDTLKDLSER